MLLSFDTWVYVIGCNFVDGALSGFPVGGIDWIKSAVGGRYSTVEHYQHMLKRFYGFV